MALRTMLCFAIVAAAMAACHPLNTSTPADLESSGLAISSPVRHQVFQRSSLRSGSMRIALSSLPAGTEKVVVRLEGQDHARQKVDQPFDLAPRNGAVDDVITVPAGGWYRVTVSAQDAGGKSLGQATVEQVGVGEVFLVAGQSNSTNCGDQPLPQYSRQQASEAARQAFPVATTNGRNWDVGLDPQLGTQDEEQCRGGSSWPAAGEALAKAIGVPVAFASTGYSGTALAQWLPDSAADLKNRLQATFRGTAHPAPTTLFATSLERMKQLGAHGFRAVLWHQGEDDARLETPGDAYAQGLATLIDSFRQAMSWNDMPWLVAQAALCEIEGDPWGYKSGRAGEEAILSAITGAQEQVWKKEGVYPGPNTDQFTRQAGYRGNSCHWSARGQQATGQAWAEKIQAFLNQTLMDDSSADDPQGKSDDARRGSGDQDLPPGDGTPTDTGSSAGGSGSDECACGLSQIFNQYGRGEYDYEILPACGVERGAYDASGKPVIGSSTSLVMVEVGGKSQPAVVEVPLFTQRYMSVEDQAAHCHKLCGLTRDSSAPVDPTLFKAKSQCRTIKKGYMVKTWQIEPK